MSAAVVNSGERLFVRLPNWVGDVCMALPALDLLRRSGFHPVLVGKGFVPGLVEGLGLEVATLPKGTVAQVRRLQDLRCRRGLLFPNSWSSAFTARLAGISCWGHAGDGRSLLLDGVITRRRGLHEVETSLRLAWHLVGDEPEWTQRERWPRPPRHLGLRPSPRQEALADQALTAAGIAGPFVVIAPLAVGTIGGRSKVWPHFATLGARLSAAGNDVVACPGPGEDAAMAAVLPQARLLAGLDLGTYAAVCAKARAVVANDSGPMHLAAAVDAPVVGIFGNGDPGRTGPWGPRASVLGDGRDWPEPVTVMDHLVSRMGVACGC